MSRIKFTHYLNRAKFGDINVGHTFSFDGSVYMKTQEVEVVHAPLPRVNCVCLYTGELRALGDTIEVFLVDVKATVKDGEAK